MSATRVVTMGLVLALGLGAAACGRKTPPRPPELVAPQPVGSVALARATDGILVSWSRPTEYVDGTSMEDLGGFVVQRQSTRASFDEIGRVPVTDSGRFQKAKRFRYLDRNVEPDLTYRYRIVAFTADGYYSAPSDVAAIVWTQPDPATDTREGDDD